MITLQRPITDQEVETYREGVVVRLHALFGRHWMNRLRELAEEMLTLRSPREHSANAMDPGHSGRWPCR